MVLNKIIDIVEDNVTTNPKELLSILERETGYQSRQLSEVFSFMTNTSIKQYHTTRRLEFAAKKLADGFSKSLASLAQEIGYNDQAAFTNAFKKQFNVTPMEAKKSNIVTRGKMKINFSIEWGDRTIETRQNPQNENSLFGMSKAKLDEVQKLLGIAAFYGMSKNQANIVYDISQEYKLGIDSAFELFDDYLELCTWDIVKEGLSVTKFYKKDYIFYEDLTITKC